MKFKALKGLVVAGLISLSIGFISEAGIVGSAHDFRGKLGDDAKLAADGVAANAEICISCHTPHNGDSTTGPLWNHDASTASYTLYASPTLNATLGQPAGVSLLCLSCHDGTVAVDSYGGQTGTVSVGDISADAALDTNLSNDHPIGFNYDAAATADGDILTSSDGSVASLLGGYSTMECSTCHDVHNGGTGAFLLKISNAGSSLCLTCHQK